MSEGLVVCVCQGGKDDIFLLLFQRKSSSGGKIQLTTTTTYCKLEIKLVYKFEQGNKPRVKKK